MTHIISARLRGMNHRLVHWDKKYIYVQLRSLLFWSHCVVVCCFSPYNSPQKEKEQQKMFSSIEVEKAKELKGNKHIPPKSQ